MRGLQRKLQLKPSAWVLLTQIIAFGFCICIIIMVLQESSINSITSPRKINNRIKIGLVTCVGNAASIQDTNAVNEVLTLIKSTLISAKLHGVQAIDFHIFTDSTELEHLLRLKFTEYMLQMEKYVNAQAYFYCVFRAVPYNYVNDFVLSTNKTLPCTYIRLFFPDVLQELDEILYLDTDIIITGDIGHIWDTFRNVTTLEIATFAPNNEPENIYYKSLDKRLFGDIPHVPPKGVNAGVMFMKLDAMRNLNWTNDLLELRKYYMTRNIDMNDQRVINIYFHNYPDRIKILPCQFNFMHLHCDKGLVCKSVLEDPAGIQILHGANGTFQNRHGPTKVIYDYYKNFDMSKIDYVEMQVIRPIYQFYTTVKSVKTCNGLIGSYLFRDLFNILN